MCELNIAVAEKLLDGADTVIGLSNESHRIAAVYGTLMSAVLDMSFLKY